MSAKRAVRETVQKKSERSAGTASRRLSPVGRHLPTSGGLSGTLAKAREQGCEAVQIFVSNPQGWAPAKPRADAGEFRRGLEEHGIGPVVVHAKYLINPAAKDPAQRERSVEALASEMAAAGALGAELVVVHSGSHGSDGEAAGIERLAGSLDLARKLAPELCARYAEESGEEVAPAEVVVENSCGAGTQILSDLDSLSEALVRADARVCIDTAHAFVAGYDLASPEGAREFGRELGEKLAGRVAVIHLNDAKNALGSNRDGHARLGEGRIPPEALAEFLREVRGVPLVMETPYDTPEVDAEQVRIAKTLAGGLRLVREGI